MNEEEKDSASAVEVDKPVRPALIASERTVREYSMFLKHLLVGLADESIPSAIVWPRGWEAERVVPPSVEIIHHPAFELALFWRQSRKALIEQLEKFNPSVLHCLCESKAAFIRHLSRRLDLPYVLGVNSLQKGFERLSISSRRCAKIIVPTKSIAANLAKVYPRFAERIEQINVGSFVLETAGCFRESSWLASMVTLCPSKQGGGFENLLGAVKRLAIEEYDFMLVVIGVGRGEKVLRKLVAALGLSQIVTIIPRLEPWGSMLAAGDIFIQAESSRAFNPLLLDVMSTGTAVAACRGGVDDLIIEDETAVVFDPEDELSIYQSLQQLLGKRDSARQLGRRAQEYLKKNHTVSGMVSSTLQVYRDAQDWLKAESDSKSTDHNL